MRARRCGELPPGLRWLLEATLVGALTVLLAAWELGLWRADLALPLRYAAVDDTKFYLMLVKGIIEHHSYLANPSLGWPAGQHLADYPQGADNLNLLIIRAIAVFSSDPALVVNVFFLATFALVAGSAHLVLRHLGASAAAAAIAAALFSLLSYHFFRGESHLLLSAYYSVPPAAYLFLRVLAQRPLFARRAASSRRGVAWASGRTLTTVALCVVIGSDNLYYATFAAVLLAAAVLVTLVLRRGAAALDATVAVALVALTLAVNLAPTLVYRVRHGVDPVLQRSAATDQRSNEGLSLRLANVLLPAPDGRIAPLAHLAAHYDRAVSPGYCESCYASLGAVGTIGFIWLALVALGTLVGAGAWSGSRPQFRHAAAGAGIAFAVGTVGGISSLLEFYVTPDIRAWNRISLFIAFFSLLAIAWLLNSLRAGLRPRLHGRFLAAAAFAGVLAFGVYEQSSSSSEPDYATAYREYRSDATFVSEIQARLPRGAAVFQLPYVPFPEGYPDTPCCGPVATYATKYEPLRGYLHSTTLRWSYGAVKGRAADWPAALAGQPLSLVLPAVVAVGFDGLWLDPAGFFPVRAHRIQAALRGLLHEAPLLSPDRDLWFFDLRPYAERLRRVHSAARLRRLRELVLQPPVTRCASGGVTVFTRALGGFAPGHAGSAGGVVVGLMGPGCRG